ncbi:hypothetical protein [Corynebacterium propinquum]|uniref:hypothetical protein n=1 Tax=Corynebacterium propinquum TaxID=43769 RepID=UPI003B6334F6
MSKSAILSVRIIADAAKAKAGFNQAAKGADDFQKSAGSSLAKYEQHLNKATAAMSAVSAGVIAMGKKSLDAASNLQQSTGAVESVFQGQANRVKEFSDQAAQAVGLSKNQYNELASVLGAQLKNIGVEQGALVGQTNDLIKTGADLAATFGGTTADAVSALSALMRGERDPIERYGVSIKQATIEAKLAEMGLKGLEGEAKTAAETQATLALLTEQTSSSMGQFAREADTAAGAQQRAAAEWENAKASLGEALLPYAAKAATVLGDLAKIVGEHPELFQIAAAAVLGLTGALLGLRTTITVVQTLKTANDLLNLSMLANPYVAVAAAVAALVAIFIHAYNTNEDFRASVDRVVGALKTGFLWVLEEAKRLLELLALAFTNPRDALVLFADLARQRLQTVSNYLSGVQNWLNAVAESATGPGRLIAIGFNWAIERIQEFIGWIKSAYEWVTSFGTTYEGGHAGGYFSAAAAELTMTPNVDDILRFAHAGPDLTAAFSTPLRTLAPRFAVNPQKQAPVINITLNGPVDPQESARLIGKELRKLEVIEAW